MTIAMTNRKPLELGDFSISVAARDAIHDAEQCFEDFLAPHRNGFWGNVGPEVRAKNEERARHGAGNFISRVRGGGLISSCYTTRLGVRIWVMTHPARMEGQPATTRITLADEFEEW